MGLLRSHHLNMLTIFTDGINNVTAQSYQIIGRLSVLKQVQGFRKRVLGWASKCSQESWSLHMRDRQDWTWIDGKTET